MLEDNSLPKCFVLFVRVSIVIAIVFAVTGCYEENKNSSAHTTTDLQLFAEINATETGAVLTARMEVDEYSYNYEARLVNGDAVYAGDGVTDFRLTRHSKAYEYIGEFTNLASRRVQLRFERGSDKYANAPDTIALLPMPALVYVEDVISNDQEIVIDWRLDPELPGESRLSGTVELIECSDLEDAELLALYFPKTHSTTVLEGELSSISSKDFLPRVNLQPADYECLFNLQLTTSAPAIAVDAAYGESGCSNCLENLIVSEAVSEVQMFTIQRTVVGESQ